MTSIETTGPDNKLPPMTPEVQRAFDYMQEFLGDAPFEVPFDSDGSDGQLTRDTFIDLPDGRTVSATEYLHNPKLIAGVSMMDAEGMHTVSADINHDGEIVLSDGSDPYNSDEKPLTAYTTESLAEALEVKRATAAKEQAVRARVETASFGGLQAVEHQKALEVFDQALLSEEARTALESAGLLPTSSQELAEALTAYYSDVFRSDGDRLNVIAYIQSGDEVKPYYYYLSRSQAVWRLLPNYKDEAGKPVDIKFGKGESELSLTLPIPMQQALTAISEQFDEPTAQEQPDLYKLIVPKNDVPEDVLHLDRVNLIDGAIGLTLDKPFPTRPEEVVIDAKYEDLAPDFSTSVAKWRQSRGGAGGGPVDVEVVTSRGGEVAYMYMRDTDGRVWIGGAEDTTAPIRLNGLRQAWMNLGVAATPGIDYANQVDEYGGEYVRGNYVDVYEKYLSKLPLIKDYVASRQLEA